MEVSKLVSKEMKKIASIILVFVIIISSSQVRTNLPISTPKTNDILKPNPKGKNKLYIDFKTGNDNLEPKEFQKNPSITIVFHGKPDIAVEDINKGQTWPNQSNRRVTIELPDDIKNEDFAEIIVKRLKNGNLHNEALDYLKKDDWVLDRLTVTSEIWQNDKKVLTKLLDKTNLQRGLPIFVFRYTDQYGSEYGEVFKMELLPRSSANERALNSVSENSKNMFIDALFGTGGDDLRGGNDDNVNVTFTFKNSPKKITISSLNRRHQLKNFTETSYISEIPNSEIFEIDDIKTVEIHHTGGGGIGADNWDVDKIKISVSKNGISKILVDKVGAPIKRFTGESRVLRIAVN